MIKRTQSEVMLLVLSAISALFISPFVYFRYIDGDLIVAFVDTLIILALGIFFIFVYKTRKIATAKMVLAIFLAIAIVLAVSIRGQSHLYWLYPAIIAFYYTLPERSAGIICLIAITMIALQISPILSHIDFFTIVMSLLLTTIFSYTIFSNYRQTNEKLALLATIDPLTFSGNRRALNIKLSDILADQQRQASDVSLLLLDLDLFKRVNDQHGHAVGDQVLVEVTQVLRSNTRALDTLFRYGGEEFVIVPLKVDLASGMIVAEKLRLLVAQHQYVNDLKITISIGVAQYRVGETAEAWVARADAALYKAKDAGRNKVMSAMV